MYASLVVSQNQALNLQTYYCHIPNLSLAMALRRLLRRATSFLLHPDAPAVKPPILHSSSAQDKLGIAIEERFACKSFLPDAVPDKTLEKILKLTLVQKILKVAHRAGHII